MLANNRWKRDLRDAPLRTCKDIYQDIQGYTRHDVHAYIYTKIRKELYINQNWWAPLFEVMF